MAKGKKTKKKNMKLRRQLRKTLGCLFMVSALLVTAIPVQPTEAAGTGWDTNNTGSTAFATSTSSVIPTIQENTPIYQTGDGNYRFAYVDSKGNWDGTSENNKFAVIVGYEKAQPLPNGLLTIPDTADAYVKYTDTLGSTGGYAAANKQGKPLYYKTTKVVEEIVDGDPVLSSEDKDGNGKLDDYDIPKITKQKTVFASYAPCTLENKSQWNDGISDVPLYYSTNTTGIPVAADLVNESGPWTMISGDADGRIRDAVVKYIANQYATYDTADNKWVVKNKSSMVESVFGGTGEGMTASNVVTLTVGKNLSGIGNYAFYGCTNLRAFNPNNGLTTLGNYAFANCINLASVNMDYYTNLSALGDHAFSNCGMLTSFVLPTATQVIGDFCFENCTKLKTVDMTGATLGADHNYSLNKIGYKAFINCIALESLTLPTLYHGADHNSKDAFHLSTVQGCKGLKFISTQSQRIDFVTDAAIDGKVDGGYDFEKFIADVGAEFYFEAPGYTDGSNNKTKTPAHNTANVNHIAFKYYGEDKYEIVEKGTDIEGKTVGLVYAVNRAGDLTVFRVETTTGTIANVQVPEIVMPEKIGPYGIRSIVEGSFSDNCWIKKVTIPASVESIGDNSFKGCHNLNHIIFTNAANITSIGSKAFATQQIRTDPTTHASGGVDGNSCKVKDDIIFGASTTPFLSFSGAIEKSDGTNTEPFKYAMKPGSNINQGRQPLTYITYYSGIPTNLTVKYNPDTQMSELQNFPTKAEVTNGFKDGTNYIYPYVTAAISAEAAGAFGAGTLTENQANLKSSVENVVIPNGVNSVKAGLFSGLDSKGNVIGQDKNPDELGDADPTYTFESPSQDIQSITAKSIGTIEPYTFARMPALKKAYVSGAAEIQNYAFDKDTELESAEVGAATTALGLRPFSGCTSLTEVTFPNSTSFAYNDGIIYGLKDGAKTSIVQCLPSRGGDVGSGLVGPDELIGITDIEPEAFMDCDEIGEVNFSKSSIKEIPERCFAESKLLYKVTLPDTAKAIRKGSFWNTPTLKFVQIPSGVTTIAAQAFADTSQQSYADGYGDDFKLDADHHKLEFICLPDSTAALYAVDYVYIGTTTSDDLKTKWSVMFFDTSSGEQSKWTLIKEEYITHGENVTPPTPPDHTAEGLEFVRWSPSESTFNPVTQQREVLAIYEKMDAVKYTVRFFDINKKEMTDYTDQVVEGKDAVAPPASAMEVQGKVFTGWDRDITKVSGNIDTYAQYSDREPGTYIVRFWTDDTMTQLIGKVQVVKEGEAAIEPAHPKKEGFTFKNWLPASGWEKVTKDLDVIAIYEVGNGSGNNGNNGNNGNDGNNGNNGNSGNNGGGSGSSSSDSSSGNSVSGNGTKYKVVVNGGSGSGEYTAGTIVPINAYARADDTVFDKWTSSSNGVGFVNQTAISTNFTMPSNNVEITANYKKGGGSSSVSSNSRNTRRNTATTVDVTKGGISNTGLASANVNGSSDNYVVRITEDAQATAEIIAALEAEYGDISNIAYLPMDISLYDSTGQTKITDVSGITVDITLPLPDDLVQFAGNNKVATVINGKLQVMDAKFTTIDGVPCIQFTATHFSPYAIYVDKSNLTEGTIDATPKTGDPIHPKWFLAMGLACIAVILFCKKDKGQPRVKTV